MVMLFLKNGTANLEFSICYDNVVLENGADILALFSLSFQLDILKKNGLKN